jgi:hypothetical protein
MLENMQEVRLYLGIFLLFLMLFVLVSGVRRRPLTAASIMLIPFGGFMLLSIFELEYVQAGKWAIIKSEEVRYGLYLFVGNLFLFLVAGFLISKLLLFYCKSEYEEEK